MFERRTSANPYTSTRSTLGRLEVGFEPSKLEEKEKCCDDEYADACENRRLLKIPIDRLICHHTQTEHQEERGPMNDAVEAGVLQCTDGAGKHEDVQCQRKDEEKA